jgi:hypothetical protein
MSMEPNFTVQGRGGKVWWIDNAGTQPWSDIQQYGFNLPPNFPSSGTLPAFIGSFLLSERFHLNSGQALTVTTSIITAHFEDYFDVGFGVLLQQGQALSVLFALRPDGVEQFGDMPPTGPLTFAQSGPNVVFTPTFIQSAVNTVILGGVNYAVGQNAQHPATDLTSVCTPGVGEYQLLFGMVATGTILPAQPSALILWSIDRS